MGLQRGREGGKKPTFPLFFFNFPSFQKRGLFAQGEILDSAQVSCKLEHVEGKAPR